MRAILIATIVCGFALTPLSAAAQSTSDAWQYFHARALKTANPGEANSLRQFDQKASLYREQIANAARKYGVSERALTDATIGIGAMLAKAGKSPTTRIMLDEIEFTGSYIRATREALERLERDANSKQALEFAGIRAALVNGDFDACLALIRLARANKTASKAHTAHLTTIEGAIAFLRAEFELAASLHAQAAEFAPDHPSRTVFLSRWHQAEALSRGADLLENEDMRREALRVLRDSVLPLAPRDVAPRDWAATQAKIGETLMALSGRMDLELLNEASVAFSNALEIANRDAEPQVWAILQGDLGAVQAAIGLNGDEKTLGEAERSLRNALEVLPKDSMPYEWAAAQMLLGHVLSVGKRSDNTALREALTAYRLGLDAIKRSDDPDEWAKFQVNIGLALVRLAHRGDKHAEHDAREAFRAALDEYSRSGLNEQWAVTQAAIGHALSDDVHTRDDDSLREAAAAYAAALTVLNPVETPAQWANSQVGIGNILFALGMRGDNQNLRDAVHAYRAALTILTPNSDLENWIWSQTDAGNALLLLAQRNDDAALLKEAIHAYRTALQVDFRASDTTRWGGTQANLAIALKRAAAQGEPNARPAALAAAQLALEAANQTGDENLSNRAKKLIKELESPW